MIRKVDLFRAVLIPVFMSCSFLCARVCMAEDYSSDLSPSHQPAGAYLGQIPPGDTPVLFAPGVVSTGKEHSAAMFTPELNELWFGRLFPAKLYYMKKLDSTWTEPQLAPFCTTYNYLYPVLSPDGNRIFFTSDCPVEPAEQRLSRDAGEIWMVERTVGGWSAPVHLDSNINIGRRNSCGSIAANGNSYFTTWIMDRSMDLFWAEFIDSAYTAPRHLVEIDSPEPDHCPFVAPDETYMILSSFRGGQGRSDLFICFRKDDGTWTEPRNMGPTINSPYKDEYPYVTPDGLYLFFNSNRPSSLNQRPIEDGPGNIYWVSAAIIETLRRSNSD